MYVGFSSNAFVHSLTESSYFPCDRYKLHKKKKSKRGLLALYTCIRSQYTKHKIRRQDGTYKIQQIH